MHTSADGKDEESTSEGAHFLYARDALGTGGACAATVCAHAPQSHVLAAGRREHGHACAAAQEPRRGGVLGKAGAVRCLRICLLASLMWVVARLSSRPRRSHRYPIRALFLYLRAWASAPACASTLPLTPLTTPYIRVEPKPLLYFNRNHF